jgi:predicted DNA-binding antitoxin AbrB/MazE fold protein
MHTVEAIVKNGLVVPLDDTELEEGTRVLVTISDGADRDFWMAATEASLKKIWENEEDDIYAELLKG